MDCLIFENAMYYRIKLGVSKTQNKCDIKEVWKFITWTSDELRESLNGQLVEWFLQFVKSRNLRYKWKVTGRQISKKGMEVIPFIQRNLFKLLSSEIARHKKVPSLGISGQFVIYTFNTKIYYKYFARFRCKYRQPFHVCSAFQ